jgi:hypothetical protein
MSPNLQNAKIGVQKLAAKLQKRKSKHSVFLFDVCGSQTYIRHAFLIRQHTTSALGAGGG